MSGGKAESKAKSDNTVVVTGGSLFEENADGGLGGGSDGGGGRYRQYRNCNERLSKWGGYCSKHNLRYRA